VRYNKQGEAISFVKPGNNHHVAIYVDEKGDWQEHIATFWHAVERKKYGVPTIITNPAEVWENISPNMPESFQEQLPASANWQFAFSMQQNEMFILGLEEELYQDAISNNDNALLSKYLYRVQKLAKGDYSFRHHLETTVDDNSKSSQEMGKMKRLSLKSLMENNPHKVHVSITGKITEI
jgi:CRISPR-associated endonuclease Csn1